MVGFSLLALEYLEVYTSPPCTPFVSLLLICEVIKEERDK
jgi:hypothetical protein